MIGIFTVGRSRRQMNIDDQKPSGRVGFLANLSLALELSAEERLLEAFEG